MAISQGDMVTVKLKDTQTDNVLSSRIASNFVPACRQPSQPVDSPITWQAFRSALLDVTIKISKYR